MSTLIVVDENDLDRRILKFSLEKYPVSDYVLYYEESSSLIKYLKDHKGEYGNLPDAVFLHLPEDNGLEILDQLKKIYPTLSKSVRIYVVSASVSSQDRFSALNYGFIHRFISKPITKDILAEISSEMIKSA